MNDKITLISGDRHNGSQFMPATPETLEWMESHVAEEASARREWRAKWTFRAVVLAAAIFAVLSVYVGRALGI